MNKQTGAMRAKDILSPLILPLKPTDPGGLALDWMEDLGVSQLPLVDGKQLLGLIGAEDIYGLDDPGQPLGNATFSLNAHALDNHHLYEVLKLAAAERLSVIPVLDENNHYLGSITRAGIIEAMAGFTAAQQPGGILVLEVSPRQYALSEIAKIVEANDAKVLSASVTSAPDSKQLEVTIKVSVMDLSSIIQTFIRYDYNITASFAREGHYDAMLSDRYDSLMKYLET